MTLFLSLTRTSLSQQPWCEPYFCSRGTHITPSHTISHNPSLVCLAILSMSLSRGEDRVWFASISPRTATTSNLPRCCSWHLSLLLSISTAKQPSRAVTLWQQKSPYFFRVLAGVHIICQISVLDVMSSNSPPPDYTSLILHFANATVRVLITSPLCRAWIWLGKFGFSSGLCQRWCLESNGSLRHAHLARKIR